VDCRLEADLCGGRGTVGVVGERRIIDARQAQQGRDSHSAKNDGRSTYLAFEPRIPTLHGQLPRPQNPKRVGKNPVAD
jgi:hypothetical protein